MVAMVAFATVLTWGCRMPPFDAALSKTVAGVVDTVDVPAPVARWVFTSGPPVPDVTGNGNDLLLTGDPPLLTTLDGRACLEFDTNTDLLTASSTILDAGAEGQSVSFWYHGNSFPQGAIISRYDTTSSRIWTVGPQLSGELNVMDSGGYVGGSNEDFGAPFAAASWNHLVVVFNTEVGEAQVYANGTGPVTRALDTTGFGDAGTFYVGDNPDPSNAGYAPIGVCVSDVRIYNIALNAEQAAAIFAK